MCVVLAGSLLMPALSHAMTDWVSAPYSDGDGTFTVSWRVDPGPNQGGYAYLKQRVNGGSWVQIASEGFGQHSKTVTVNESGEAEFKVDWLYMPADPCGSQWCNPSPITGSTAVESVNVVPAPDKPTLHGLSASACTNSFEVDWSPGSGYPSGAQKRFRVYEVRPGGGEDEHIVVASNAWTRDNPQEDSTYTYKVRAYYRYNTSYSPKSGWTATKSVHVPACTPNKPGTPQLSRSGTSVSVSWNAPSGGGPVEDYRLQQRGRERGGSWGTWSTKYTGSNRSKTISGLNRDWQYQYQVRAENDHKDGSWSSHTTVTIPWAKPGTPDQPDLSQPDPAGATTVKIDWNKPSGHIDGYHIQRRNNTDGGSYTTIKTITDPNDTDYTNGNPEQNHNYSYRVRAYNNDRNGNYSSGRSIRVEYLAPDSPDLTEDADSFVGYLGVYKIGLEKNSGVVHGFELEEVENGPVDPGAVDWSNATTEYIDDADPSPKSYNQPDNVDGTFDYHHYRARTTNPDNPSGWTTARVKVNYYPHPGEPTDFELVPGSLTTNSYTLRWEPPSGSEPFHYYRLERSDGETRTPDSGANAYTEDFDGTSGTTYTHTVEACFIPSGPDADNGHACSGSSHTVDVYVPHGKPGTPTGLTGPDRPPEGDFTIGWSAPSGVIDRYQIERTYNGNTTIVTPDNPTATSYNETGGNGAYSFRVRACSPDINHADYDAAEACSAWSGAIGVNVFSTPSEFDYSLNNTAGLPVLGQGDFVAVTEGNLSVSQGAANYTLPIQLPPAVRELKPGLSLDYNSRGGNGLLGVGWSLSGLSTISRCSPTVATEEAEAQDSNPRYTNADRLCLDGQKLVIASGSPSADDTSYWNALEYRTETDRFAKVEAFGTHNGAPAYFEVRTKSGLSMTYGRQADGQNSRIYAPDPDGTAGPVSTWALDKVEDRYGNSYQVHYYRNTSDGHYRPKHITWAPGAAVVFSYEDRNSLIPGYRSDMPWGYDDGNRYKRPMLLSNVTTYINAPSGNPAGGQAVREYNLGYERSQTTHRYLIETVTECDFDESGVNPQCAEPLEFGWQEGELGFDTQPATPMTCGGQTLRADQLGDIDHDGYTDIVSFGRPYWGTAAGCFERAGDWAVNTGWSAGSLFRTRDGMALFVTREIEMNGQTRYELGVRRYDRPAQSSHEILLAGGYSPNVTVADVNNDGLDDAFYRELNQSAGTAFVQRATGAFGFDEVTGTASAGDETSFTDYTSDGLADYLGHFTAMRNDGGGMFTSDFDLPISDTTGHRINMFMYGTNTFMTLPGTMSRNTLDVNADGKGDLAWHHDYDDSGMGNWYIELNTGDGFGDRVETDLTTGRTNQYTYTYDWDKDGRDDLLACCTTGYDFWNIFVSTYDNGQAAFEPLDTDPFNGNLNLLASLEMGVGYAQIFRGDFNNDGLIDVYWKPDNDPARIYYAKPEQPDLLQTVTNGLGAQVELEYSPLTPDANNGDPLYTPSNDKPVFPHDHAPRSTQVVKQVSTSDGQGGWRDRYYHYTGAKVHLQGRGSLGFEQIKVTNTSQDTVTTTVYHQAFPFTGKVKSRQVEDLNGNLIRRVGNEYTVHDVNARFAYLSQSIEREYRLTTSQLSNPLSVTKVVNNYDQYGTLEQRTTTVGTGLSGETVTGIERVKTVDNEEVTHETGPWLIGFVERRKTRVTKANGAEPREIITEFDPEPGPGAGTLDILERRDFVGTDIGKTTVTHRNADGVVTGTTVTADDIDQGATAARETELTDFTDQMYPGKQLNAKDHATTFDYDKRSGKIRRKTRVLSDAGPVERTTERTYDALGRLERETSPDDVVNRIKRFWCDGTAPLTCPGGAEYLVATETVHESATGHGAPLEIVFYDKLQREVQSRTYTLGEIGATAVKVDTAYYADGQTQTVSEPYTGAEPQHQTEYKNYDALNRPRDIDAADGGSVHYNYTAVGTGSERRYQTEEVVTVVKPTGNPDTRTTTRLTNALGQVTQVVDANGTPVDYTYDALGNLETTKVNSDDDTEIQIQHDAAGNKTRIEDPDAGTIAFEYNGLKELRRQTWAPDSPDNKKTMVLRYDTLGRKVERIDTPAAGTQTTYTWNWDNELHGRLDGTSGNGFSETYDYNGAGRLEQQTTLLDGLGQRKFDYTYDDFGRPETAKYPDGLKIEHRYHALGPRVQTRDITDGADRPLWTRGDVIDARGRSTLQRFGNGVITRRSFDPESGRVGQIKTGWPGANGVADMAGNIQDLAFQFDSLGNLHNRNTGRSDLNGQPVESISETFSYDDLNRLKESVTTWDFDSQNARERDYDYDDLGNLTSRTDLGPLTYDQSNGAGIHAVTQANGLSYQYDVYGNIVQRGSETIEYNVFNKPTRIGNVTFQYGPDHQRFKQVDGNRTVYYFNGGQYKEIVDNNGTITRNTVGGYYVRETSGSGVKETYLHKDHLGSTGAMTDKWGNLVDRMSFGPWGKRQMADWSDGDPTGGQSGQYPTDKGFTGHEMLDSTSLVHMNGRVYDPVIGRFLSPDLLVQAPHNSQSYNRYSYVLNNPLSLVDPSGYHGTDPQCQLSCLYTGPLGTVGLFSSISAGKFAAHYRSERLGGVTIDPAAVEKMTAGEKKALVGELKKMQEANGGYVKINGEKYVISTESVAASSYGGITMAATIPGVDARQWYDMMDAMYGEGWEQYTGTPELFGLAKDELGLFERATNHLTEHGRVGWVASFGIKRVASATIDLGSARLRDKTGERWTPHGKVAEFSEGRVRQALELPVMGISMENRTFDNGRTWTNDASFDDIQFERGLLIDLFDGGDFSISISVGVGYVYENTFTFGD